MRQDHRRRFVRDDGQTFTFDSPYDIANAIPGERLGVRLGIGETPGEDGEYQDPFAAYEARTVTLRGKIISTDLTTHQDRLDTLFGFFRKGFSGKLYREILDLDTGYVLASRYLPCKVQYREKAEENGLPTGEWEIGFRSPRPLYYEDTYNPGTGVVTVPRTQALANTNAGVTTITPGGAETVLPVITLVVTTPGTISLTPGGTSCCPFVMTLVAAATGTYVIDSDAIPPSVTKSGVSFLSQLSGGFLFLPPTVSTLTTALSGGAVLSNTSSIAWRRRYPFT
jgi:hypothetical protein